MSAMTNMLERIYTGRRFRNDTERLEKLFEMYAKMSEEQPQGRQRLGPIEVS